MHSFIVHAFAPPSSEGLEPPLSGRVSGGNMKGGGPPSSPLDEGDEGASAAVASSDVAPESSEGAGLPPLLPLPPLEAEHVMHASSPDGCRSPLPKGRLADPAGDDIDGAEVGVPLAAQAPALSATSIPNRPFQTVVALFFCVARITRGKTDGVGRRGLSPTRPLSCHFRPAGTLH